jgi:hypothetical protein
MFINEELFLGCNIICLFFSAMAWAGKVGRTNSAHSPSLLCNKYLCSNHFLESDYRTAEMIHLNHLAVPCGTNSALQSVPQHSVQSKKWVMSRPLEIRIKEHKHNLTLGLPERTQMIMDSRL